MNYCLLREIWYKFTSARAFLGHGWDECPFVILRMIAFDRGESFGVVEAADGIE